MFTIDEKIFNIDNLEIQSLIVADIIPDNSRKYCCQCSLVSWTVLMFLQNTKAATG